MHLFIYVTVEVVVRIQQKPQGHLTKKVEHGPTFDEIQ